MKLDRNLFTIVKSGLSCLSPWFGYRFLDILDLYKPFSLLPSWTDINISKIELRNWLVSRIIYKDLDSLILYYPAYGNWKRVAQTLE